MDDIKDYLHPLTQRWYSARGILYRKGYLFTGPPGCGKTSLCFAAAGKLGLKIYIVSLNSRRQSEESLSGLFARLPQKCILLIEDVDTAGITHARSKAQSATRVGQDSDNDDSDGDSECSNAANGVKRENNEKNNANDPKRPSEGISLSDLLNTIDGIASAEGRVLIMTTNHAENLDSALLRPGRIDMTIKFGYVTAQANRELFRTIYGETDEDKLKSPFDQGEDTVKLETSSPPRSAKSNNVLRHGCSSEEIAKMADDFARFVPSGKFTPAQVQGYLLKHKNTPRKAVKGAIGWVKETRMDGEGMVPYERPESSQRAVKIAECVEEC